MLRYPRRTVLIAVLLGVVAAVLGIPPKVDSNMIALLPKSDPYAVALRELHESEGGANFISFTFAGEDPEALSAAMDALATDFEQLDSVRFAVSRLDPDLAFRVGLLQLETQDVLELNHRLRGALALGSALNPIVTQRLMDMGPTTQRIAGARETSLLQAGDGQARVLVRPTGSNLDAAFCERVIADLEGVLARHDLPAKGISLVYRGGAYHNVAEDIRGIRADLVRTSLVSAALVVLILIVSFRSWKITVLMLPPLLLANLVNLALVTLTMGALNTYTSLANAILIGLGIDFAVHLVGRYREKRGMGLGIEDAIARAWDVTGPPCTTAALTSAAGFLALAVGRFRGFSQLGILLAAGLMVCLLAMLVLLPVLLRLFDPEPPPRLARHVEGGDSRSSYRLAPIGLMAAVLTTGVAGAAWLPELGFEYDISQLRRVGKAYDELSELEQRLQREAYSPVVVTLGSRADVASEHRRIEKLVEEGRLPHVRQVLSIESLLPSDQAARITALAETARLVSSPNLRYLPPPLVKQLLPLRDYDARPVREDELPEGVLTLLGAAEGRHRVLLALQGNMWDMRESAALIDELQGVVERPAGEFLAQGAMYRTVMRDIPIVAFLALFLVAVLTAIDTRNLTHALGALGALLAGMVWAGVGLYFAGVKLTLVNVVGVPILLGIGVDVVIHLLHRLREEGPGGVRRAYATAGVAATISTVTTIASFSSLLLAGNRGVRGLGLLVVVGLSAVSLVGAMLLPLAWATGWRLTGRAPAQRPDEAAEEA